jgi:hypothetical protein
MPSNNNPPGGLIDNWGTHVMLRWGSAIMGLICLGDCAWEGLSAGRWHSHTGIYRIYYATLGFYVGTKEVHKWTAAPGLKDDVFLGEVFAFAWLVLPIVLYARSAFYYPIVWPSMLEETFWVVFGVYMTGTTSHQILKAKVAGGWRPGGAGAAPAGGQSDAQTVARACQELGTFTIQELMARTGLTLPAATGHLGQFILNDLVRKLEDGRYQWIGPLPPHPPS